MCPHVATEVRLLRERSAACVAPERLFPTVRSEMRPQNAVVGKPTTADEADKPAPRLLLRGGIVTPHVLVEVAALRERAVALCTHEGALAAVQSKVRLQVAALRKAAIARLANERPNSSVDAFMSLQV